MGWWQTRRGQGNWLRRGCEGGKGELTEEVVVAVLGEVRAESTRRLGELPEKEVVALLGEVRTERMRR